MINIQFYCYRDTLGALLSLVCVFFNFPLRNPSIELRRAPRSLLFREGGACGGAAGWVGGGGGAMGGGWAGLLHNRLIM